jgi:uncharacterized membrane protein
VSTFRLPIEGHFSILKTSWLASPTGVGKVQLEQSVNLLGIGAASDGASGAFWGTRLGLLFLAPLAGFGGLAGAGAGVLSGSMLNCGVDASFAKSGVLR